MNEVIAHRLKRKWRIILIVLGVLLAIRIALPYIVLRLVNDRLAKMPGYRGHVQDIDIALIRGAYVIDTFYLNKLDSVTGNTSPFLGADLIDLSVEWKALFHGAVVGELEIERPAITFTLDSVEPAQVQKDTADFRELLHDLMPLRINRVAVHHGVLSYRDPKADPPVDVHMTELDVLAKNLRNTYDEEELLPASINASAALYDGSMTFNMKLNPLSPQPLFDMNAELEQMDLTQVNDFFKAYANVDVNKGRFGLYAEIATRDGAFTGYVKPILKDLDVLGPEDKHDGVLQKLWEGIAGTVADVLTNPKRDQVATRVELKGKLKDPDISTWYAVIDLLRNAFIRAIVPAIDNEIGIGSVNKEEEEKPGFFKRLFGKEEKK
jgi:hypothetical protein